MKKARFNVYLNKAPEVTSSVNFSTRDGTAKKNIHYRSKTGTLVFAPGETSKQILVDLVDTADTNNDLKFYVDLHQPDNLTIGKNFGEVNITGNNSVEQNWLNKFNYTYDLLRNTDNGFFGPPNGEKAFRIPYHARERAITIEAPDWTHQSVSETVSFWVKMEAWKTILSDDATGLNEAWSSIDDLWVPSAAAQPWGAYNVSAPAGFIADATSITDTPVHSESSFPVGHDPLAQALEAAYGNKHVYLMHWLIDVDGDYGFKNHDGSSTGVFINNFQRGPSEDGVATITHPCWENLNNGGHPLYGFLPIYTRSKDVYTDGSVNSFAAQANYSMAGDADVRAVANIHQTIMHSKASIPQNIKDGASKMADYIRYTLHDKYFKNIPNFSSTGCHYLLSWGAGFGVEIPSSGNSSGWGFRIGNSEIHHGYNGVDVAYAARINGELLPKATGAASMWTTSLNRQLELIRWLQSPEGPIAGGVTSSWRGSYLPPTDGRENATFYGLYYTYSPSWFNPPSNDWVGFQAWSLDRVAAVFIHATKKKNTENNLIANKCAIILDKFIKWFYSNCTISWENNKLEYPQGLIWTSPVIVDGQTATEKTPNYSDANPLASGVYQTGYEYLPSTKWPGENPDYSSFWDPSKVPNPNLHCKINSETLGWDPGVGAGLAQVLIQYTHAKVLQGLSLSDTIPGTTIAYQDVLVMAADMLTFIWDNRDEYGFGFKQKMDYTRIRDKIWIPPEFGTGYMPRGDKLKHNETTFASARKALYETTAEWDDLNSWLDGEKAEPPKIKFHRFWNGAEVAVGFAMLQKYFPSVKSSKT